MSEPSHIRRGAVCLASYTFPHERAIANVPMLEKERPILIVQNNADNDNPRYPLVMAAPITTQKTERVYEQDVLLPVGEANLEQTSKVLLGLSQPFLKTRVGRRCGQLSSSKQREVDLKLFRLFGFAPEFKE